LENQALQGKIFANFLKKSHLATLYWVWASKDQSIKQQSKANSQFTQADSNWMKQA
jgi:hypothetical protein